MTVSRRSLFGAAVVAATAATVPAVAASDQSAANVLPDKYDRLAEALNQYYTQHIIRYHDLHMLKFDKDYKDQTSLTSLFEAEDKLDAVLSSDFGATPNNREKLKEPMSKERYTNIIKMRYGDADANILRDYSDLEIRSAFGRSSYYFF